MEMTSSIIEYIISPILVAFLGYITYLLRDNRKKQSANNKGIMLLLRGRIIAAHQKYCVRGEEMTAFDFSDLEEIHRAYKELDGNGLTDKMWEDLKELNMKS